MNTSQRLSVSGIRFINSSLPIVFEPLKLNKPNQPPIGHSQHKQQILHHRVYIGNNHCIWLCGHNIRLNADVEVGTLLSGGIDSTTITALAAEIHPNIRSFSVAIEVDGFSERNAIVENQRHLQSHSSLHSTLWSFVQHDFEQALSSTLDHMDEPLADSSLIVTWFLFQQIQAMGFKCVLSGDGADEIFAGYPTYTAAHWMNRHIPHIGLRKILAPFVKRIPASHKGVSWEEMLKRWTSINQNNRLEWWKEHQLWMGAWIPENLVLDYGTSPSLVSSNPAPESMMRCSRPTPLSS